MTWVVVTQWVRALVEEGLSKDGQPRRQGRCFLTRFADDCRGGCAVEAAARRVMAVLPQRCARYRLPRPPENTVVLACKRPPSRTPSAGGPGPCGFRGLPHAWGTTRQGDGVSTRKASGKRRRWCRKARGPGSRAPRHAPLAAPHRRCRATWRGSYQWAGIGGTCTRLEVVG